MLCGDAAHAMPPFLGQGANQAVLDGVRLARELKAVGAEHADVRAALGAYQRARWFPTARLLANSRILGFLETQRGAGALFRDAFFFTTGKLGIAEKVFLDQESGEDNSVTLDATINTLDYQGQLARYFLRAGEHTLQAINTIDVRPISEGTAVKAQIRARDCVVLPPDRTQA